MGLADRGTHRDGRLETTQIRGGMNDGSALSPGSGVVGGGCCCRRWLGGRSATAIRSDIYGTAIRTRRVMISRIAVLALGIVIEVAVIEQVDNASTQRTRLQPAAIGEGRIVGSGRGEMPVFVRGIETSAMSVKLV